MDVSIQAIATGAGNLIVVYSDNNFGPASGALSATITGGLISGAPTVDYAVYGDGANTTSALTTLLTDTGTLSWPLNSTVSGSLTLGAPYALSEAILVTAPGAAQFNLDASFSVTPAALTLGCAAATGQVGVPFNSNFPVSGGVYPYTFAITSNSLPAGLTLNPTTGAITGTPTTAGTFNFTVQVTDSSGSTAGTQSANCSIIITPPIPACTASFCGTVFADCDGNGELTAGDVGLTKVLVELLNSAGAQVASTTTATNGAYCFSGLANGTYTVVVIPPAGYKETAASTGYHWTDNCGRVCWLENDSYAHCNDSGTEWWVDNKNCKHWKNSSGKDCWYDNYNSYHCQPFGYVSCNAPTNNNCISVTLTNCQSLQNVNFSYTGTQPSISVCVTAPSGVKCGQKVTFSCAVTNTGNVCFNGGTVCYSVGNCNSRGWSGPIAMFNNTCPGLAAGQGCVLQQTCTVNSGNVGSFGCKSLVFCSQPYGQTASGQSSCTTQVTW